MSFSQPRVFRRRPAGGGEVRLVHVTLGKRRVEHPMSVGIFGEYEEPRDLFIEPMRRPQPASELGLQPDANTRARIGSPHTAGHR